MWKETKKTKIPKRAKDQKTERLEIQKDKNAKRQKYNKTKRQKIQQDKKTKIPKREFKIVMSGQFCTLAMFCLFYQRWKGIFSHHLCACVSGCLLVLSVCLFLCLSDQRWKKIVSRHLCACLFDYFVCFFLSASFFCLFWLFVFSLIKGGRRLSLVTCALVPPNPQNMPLHHGEKVGAFFFVGMAQSEAAVLPK